MSAAANKIVDESIAIPSLPTIVAKINQLLEDPESGAREIGAVVTEDPPIASRVLRIVNSAHYGLREQVISLEHACAVLGINVLRNTVMQGALVQQFDGMATDGEFQLEPLWRHAILSGQVAQIAGRKSKAKLGLTPDELYSCGLLHDFGKVATLTSLRDEYLMAMRYARMNDKPISEVEREMLGFTHADVGARIAFRWGLPDGVVSAIQYHHGPTEELESDPAIYLVYFVNLLCGRVESGELEGIAELLTAEQLEFVGLDAESLGSLVEEAVLLESQIEI